MTPEVRVTKTDGNLGVATDTDRILAICGCASAGAFDTPTPYANKADLIAAHVSGPLVETGAYMLARGIPIVAIRSNPTTAAAYGAVDVTGKAGTATVAAGATAPHDDYDVIVKIITGGALGVAGITFIFSMDAGVNWSAETALGTSLTLTCARGVSFTLSAAASTLLANDTWKVTTTGPRNLSADVTDSLNALKDYVGEWLRCLVLAEGDATIISNIEANAESYQPEGKYPEFVINTRPRGSAETRAAYQTAMGAIAAAVQTQETSPCVDQCEMVSEVNGWRLRRPCSIPYAARLMLIDDSQDAAARADGALPGIFLTTAAGVRAYHDEFRYPGLDALGFTTLRTWGGRPVTPGAYVNNPRVLSGAGSDYRYFQHSAIVNRVIETTFQLLAPRLSQGVLVDATTGRIRSDVAKSIEDAVTEDLRTRFVSPRRVSAIQFFLSRTDNILSTDTLTFDVQVVPLGYVKKFIGKTGLVRVLAQAA